MKIELGRQEAEALMDAGVIQLRGGHDEYLYQAIQAIVMQYGMVKDESKLEEYMDNLVPRP